MNYKRRKPAYRRVRRTNGYIGLGKDKIKQQMARDHFNNISESVEGKHYFNKRMH